MITIIIHLFREHINSLFSIRKFNDENNRVEQQEITQYEPLKQEIPRWYVQTPNIIDICKLMQINADLLMNNLI